MGRMRGHHFATAFTGRRGRARGQIDGTKPHARHLLTAPVLTVSSGRHLGLVSIAALVTCLSVWGEALSSHGGNQHDQQHPWSPYRSAGPNISLVGGRLSEMAARSRASTSTAQAYAERRNKRCDDMGTTFTTARAARAGRYRQHLSAMNRPRQPWQAFADELKSQGAAADAGLASG
jgi:hypothetical protein